MTTRIKTQYFDSWESLMRHLANDRGAPSGKIGIPPNVPDDCKAVADINGQYHIIHKDDTL